MRWYHYLATIYGAGVLVMPIYQCSRSVDGRAIWPGPAWGSPNGPYAFDSTIITALGWPLSLALDIKLQLAQVAAAAQA